MSAAVSSMMPGTFPRFASASSAVSGATSKAGQPSQNIWASAPSALQGGEAGAGDIPDFDLLAEYLLEDAPGVGGLPAFDFSSETPPISEPHQPEVVSPENADSLFVDPPPEAAAHTKEEESAGAAPAAKNDTGTNDLQQTTTAQAFAEQRMNGAPASAGTIPKQTPVAPAPAPLPAAPASAPLPAAPAPAPLPAAPAPAPLPASPAPAPLPASPAPTPLPAVTSALAPLPAPTPAPFPVLVANPALRSPVPGSVAVSALHAPAPALGARAPVPAVAPASLAPAVVPGPAALVPALNMNRLPQPPLLHSTFPDTNGNKRRRVDAAAPVVAATAAVPVGTVMTMNGQILPQTFPQRGGRQKSQAQIDRRRERNRILARRTRLRKKFFFESLQKDVSDLQHENAVLKEIVRTRLSPDKARALLDECKAAEALPDIVAEQCGVPGTQLDRQDFNLIQGIQKSQQCFVITDPSLQDNPIVYASDDFLNLTGYSRDEVLGRNCRFLQGTETSASKVAQIRKAVAAGEDCTVTLINYTADGTAFWNNLFIAALRDAQNNIVNFIGVIVKVVGPDPSDPEAGKRLPGEVSPASGLDAHLPNADASGSGLANSTIYAAAAAQVAEGTVMAIEGVVTAAVAAAPSVTAHSVNGFPNGTA